MSKPKDPANPLINPTDTGDKGNPPPEPNNGDLRYLVPDVSMSPGWDPPPSFNLDPPSGSSSGGPGDQSGAVSNAFSVDLGSLRTGEQTMLSSLHTEVGQYESLRATVMGAVTNENLFGPPEDHASGQLADEPKSAPGIGSNGGAGGAQVKLVQHDATDDGPFHLPDDKNDLAEEGKAFAAAINPVQEKLLKSIGDTLELAGSFITMLNKAGQTYSRTDRAAKFPDPPGGSPVI